MKKKTLFLGCWFIAFILFAYGGTNEADKPPKDRQRLGLSTFRLPVVFEQNTGQAPESIRFVVRRLDHAVFFRHQEVVFSARPPHARRPEQRRHDALTMQFVNAQGSGPQGEHGMTTRGRYLGGQGGPKPVRLAASIVYRSIYPGIDLRFHNAGGRMRYEVVLTPQANVNDIRLRFPESRRVTTDQHGNLEVQTSTGTLRHSAPIVYGTADGSRRALRGRFVVLSSTDVGMAVTGARPGESIHIDPELAYSTYTASISYIGMESVPRVAVSGSNVDVYVQTVSSGSPPVADPEQAAYEAVLYRFDCSVPEAPILVFMVVFPSDFEVMLGLASAADGSAYVLGMVHVDFPLGVPQDSIQPTPFINTPYTYAQFLARVEADGTVQRVTYLWGLGGQGRVTSLAVEALGDAPGVYVTGTVCGYPITLTLLPPYMQNPVRPPGANALQQTAVLKLDLSLRQTHYVTFLPGLVGEAIAARAGKASVLDLGDSGYPVTSGAYQSPVEQVNSLRTFLTTLDPSGAIALSGFLGHWGRAVDVYEGGDVVSGPYLHTPQAGSYSMDVVKLSPAGDALVYRTTALPSAVLDLAADNGGGVWVGGLARDAGLATAAAVQPNLAGESDGFVALFSAAGTLDYATYLGGGGWDDVTSVARGGNVTCVAGLTNSADFPITSPSALQPTLTGSVDAFFAILSIVPVHVSVTKDGSPNQINENGHVIYTVHITNDGFESLGDLTIIDQADAGLPLFPPAWQTGGLPNWSSAPMNSWCSSGVTLGAGESLTFTVEGVGLTEGIRQNCVWVVSGGTVLASACETTKVVRDMAPALAISVEDDVTGAAPEGTQVHFTVAVTNNGNATVEGVHVHHFPIVGPQGHIEFANVVSLDQGSFSDANWSDANGYTYVFQSIEPSQTERLYVTSQPAKRGVYRTQASATVPLSFDSLCTALSTTWIGVVAANLEVVVYPPIAATGTSPQVIRVEVKVEPPIVPLPAFQLQVEIEVDPTTFPPANVSTPDGSPAENVYWFRRNADASSETWVAVFNVSPNFQNLAPGTATIRLPGSVTVQSVRAIAADPGILDADGAVGFSDGS